MHLVDEDPRLDARVAVHELARLVEVGVEDPDAADLALVGDRADDRQQPVRPQREVPPPVLPDDPLGGVRPVFVPDLEDHQAVRPGLGEHLPHEFVGDLGHAIPPFQRCWWTQLHIPTELIARRGSAARAPGAVAGADLVQRPRLRSPWTVTDAPRRGSRARVAATATPWWAAWSGRRRPAARRSGCPGRPARGGGR